MNAINNSSCLESPESKVRIRIWWWQWWRKVRKSRGAGHAIICRSLFDGTGFIFNSAKIWRVRCPHPHSRFGHYFCSNLYGPAPRRPWGVKKIRFFLQIKPLSFCTRITPKRHKLWKIVKIEKKVWSHLCWFIAKKIDIMPHLSHNV